MRRGTRFRPLTALAAGVTSGMLCMLASGCGAGVATPPHVAAAPSAAGPRAPDSTVRPTSGPTSGPTTGPTTGPSPGRGRMADQLEVDKCWTNATATTGGQLLVSARSSDPGARLRAYRSDGTLIGEVHNGGGQRYGGTVFAYERRDPGPVTIRSSSGGSITVPTAPFRPEN